VSGRHEKLGRGGGLSTGPIALFEEFKKIMARVCAERFDAEVSRIRRSA
jgi:hypothetical protein